jgi:hypothetical protein
MPEEGNVESVEIDETEVVVDETPNEEPVVEEPKVFDAEYVKKLREEAAKHRTEKQKEAEARSALEARLKEYEDAKLSVEEKAARDFQEAVEKASLFQQKAVESDLRYQLALAAKDAGITDLKAAVKLADRELIQTDENGNISNIEDVVEGLRTEYQSLFAVAPSAPNTRVTNPQRTPSAKKYTKDDLKKMSPERRTELLQKGEFDHLL